MAYKESDTGLWTAQWYTENAKGEKKKKRKRGFPTKRDAVTFEREKKLGNQRSMDMSLREFMDIYFEDKKSELKDRTIKNKKYLMNEYLVPYFGDKSMNEITSAQIIQWQHEIIEKGFSETYLRMIQNQLTSLFTHAQRVYDLQNNPCKKVKRMGKSDARRIDFWTLEEYEKFISTIEEGTRYYLIFEILFWTGCRIGELLALTPADIDLINKQINIDKTYYRTNRIDVITVPKTEQSVRVVEIPDFLAEEIKNYIDRLYGIHDDERLFPIVQEAVQHKMKRHIAKSGVKNIRVHDLRHSAVAYLIHKGVDALVIKERLGHTDIRITLNTYGHLYPSQQRTVADMLDAERKRPDSTSHQGSTTNENESSNIEPKQFDYSKDSSINQSEKKGD